MILIWSLLIGAVLAGTIVGTSHARRAPGRRTLSAATGLLVFLFGSMASAIVQLSFYPADSNTFAPLGGTTVTFASDQDMTLAVGSGQSLTIVGTISADRHVWLPCTIGEQKTVTNSTTGGFNVIVGCTLDAFGAAGTTVSIAHAATNIVNSPDALNYVLAGGGGAFDAASLIGIPPVDIDGAATANSALLTDGGAGGTYWDFIRDRNIDPAAAIAISKLANGTAGQIIVENSGGTSAAWVTAAGDCTISATGVLTCTKVNGITISGTPAAGYLPIGASSSTSVWTTVSGDCTLASSGAITCTKVNGITISGTPAAGKIPVGSSSSVSSWSTVSGDCTLASGGAITCTQLNGVTFASEFASPPGLGTTTPSSVAATTLSSSGVATLGGLYTQYIDLDSGLPTTPRIWSLANEYGQDAGTQIDFSSSGFCSSATGAHPSCNYNLTATTTDGTTWVTMTDGLGNGLIPVASSFQAWGGTLYVDDYSADGGVGSMQNFTHCRVTFDVVTRNNGTMTFIEQAGSAGGAPDGGDTVLTPISCTGVSGCTDPTASTGCVKGVGIVPNGVRVHQNSGGIVVQVQGIASTTLLWTYTPTILKRAHP